MKSSGPNGLGESVDAAKLPSQLETSSQPNHSGETGNTEVDAKPLDHTYRYKMNYPSIGQCVIINNKKFQSCTGLDNRTGSDIDAGLMRKVFSRLGYNVKTYTDQTIRQMQNLLTSVSREDHSHSASFVCVLLSHGDDGVLYGTDGLLDLQAITGLFRGDRCTTLVGKPKMFFIQACRGKELDSGVETDSCVETDSFGVKSHGRIPVEADFLFAYSTAPGYYSWRNTSNGSWFIQSLCDLLQRHAKELELLQILTRVNHRVALDFESSCHIPGFDSKKQIPCIVSMLTKDFYFSC